MQTFPALVLSLLDINAVGDGHSRSIIAATSEGAKERQGATAFAVGFLQMHSPGGVAALLLQVKHWASHRKYRALFWLV